MQMRRIRVTVEPGTFSSERNASFRIGKTRYSLIVDKQDVQDDTLNVVVVAEVDEDAIIDLPRETFTSGNRIRVPKNVLLPVQ